MFDLIKQAMFTGLGLASLTKEKLEELGQDLSRHAKLSQEQATEFQAELTKRAQQAKSELETEIDKRVEQILHRLKLVRMEEYQALAARVERLERDLTSRPD